MAFARWLPGIAIVCLLFQPAAARAQLGAASLETRRAAMEQARRDLQSTNAREIAWGAYRAAASELGPDLVRALTSPPPPLDFERYAMVSALLDASIRLGTIVPASTLRLFWKEWPVQTAILFARTSGDDANALLLEESALSTGYQWFAAANLLVDRKVPGFAAQLLASLNLVLDVSVSAAGQRGSGIAGSVFGGSDVMLRIPVGFPPHSSYKFERAGNAGFTVVSALSAGPTPVFYSRREDDVFQFFPSSTTRDGPEDRDRVAYLKYLVNRSTLATNLQVPTRERIAWRGAEDLVRQVGTFRRALVGTYQELVRLLMASGCLTPDEEAHYREPAIKVEIHDFRDDRSQPLPDIR